MSKQSHQHAEHVGARFWSPDYPVRPAGSRIFYGWVIAVLSTIGMGASMPGQTIGVGVFKTRLMEALGLSSMQLSIAYMIGTFASALFLSAGGRFFDRVGARRAVVYSIAALGCVLIAMSRVGWMSALLANLPIWAGILWVPAFVVLSLGFGLLRFTGQGMVTLTSRAMLGKWFDKRRGAVTAWSGAVVAFLFSSAPISFEYLIRSFGWQGAWLCMGLVLLGLLLPIFWAFARDNPEECGLQMDGGLRGKPPAMNPDAHIDHDYTRNEASRTLAFWVFTLMFALSGLVVTAYTFHILAIGQELGVGDDYILKLFVPGAVVSIITGFAVAWLTDQPYVRIKYLLAAMGLAGVFAYGCVAIGSYPQWSWLHVLAFGISGGSFGSLSSIVWPRFFGRKHLGAISGLFMTAIVVASAVGPFLFSLAVDCLGSYRSAFLGAAVIAMLLTVAAFWADNPQRKLEA